MSHGSMVDALTCLKQNQVKLVNIARIAKVPYLKSELWKTFVGRKEGRKKRKKGEKGKKGKKGNKDVRK